jgi:hypothetical protein
MPDEQKIDEQKIKEALSSRDPVKLAEAAGSSISALKAAEDVIAARSAAEARPNFLTLASQALVGWLALFGVALNVVQMYSSRQQFEQQRTSEETRWRAEFDRSREADKHSAFFQVAALVTDGQVDRRLIGYSLLGEFMGDKEYYDKAQLMLSERMVAETESKDFGEAHRNALRVIVRTLSQTKDCEALIQGASTVHRLKKARDAQLNGDNGIGTPVEELYADFVRYIWGRATLVCAGRPEELRLVRNEIRSALIPFVKGATDVERRAAATKMMSQFLRDRCLDEAPGAISECPAIVQSLVASCAELEKKDPKQWVIDKDACGVLREAAPKVIENAHAAVKANKAEGEMVDTAPK